MYCASAAIDLAHFRRRAHRSYCGGNKLFKSNARGRRTRRRVVSCAVSAYGARYRAMPTVLGTHGNRRLSVSRVTAWALRTCQSRCHY